MVLHGHGFTRRTISVIERNGLPLKLCLACVYVEQTV